MEDLVVREPHDQKASESGPIIASAIVVRALDMDSAIGLHDQKRFFGEEVGVVRPEWLLPAELDPIESSVPQIGPQKLLCACRRTPQLTCSEGLAAKQTCHDCHSVACLRLLRGYGLRLPPLPPGEGLAVKTRNPPG
jgi:hypothetical protein